jgi:hypothetical protein
VVAVMIQWYNVPFEHLCGPAWQRWHDRVLQGVPKRWPFIRLQRLAGDETADRDVAEPMRAVSRPHARDRSPYGFRSITLGLVTAR